MNRYPSMLDLAKRTGSSRVVGLIEANTKAAPEYGRIPVRTIAGTTYLATTRVSLPAPKFRHVNQGSETLKSEYKQDLRQLFFIDAPIEVDTALLEAEDQGNSVGSLMNDEATGVMLGLMLALGSQFYYGLDNDAKGFQGLHHFVHEDMIVDATGNTANTGSSVFGVKLGKQAVEFVAGANSSLKMAPWQRQRISRVDPLDGVTKSLTAMITNLQGWIGLDCGHEKSVCQIYNLTDQDGKGWTDKLSARALEKYPVGWKPDFWLATPRSIRQLQESRSAVNQQAYKAGAVAEYPTESQGVPIIPTDSIKNTEAIVA